MFQDTIFQQGIYYLSLFIFRTAPSTNLPCSTILQDIHLFLHQAINKMRYIYRIYIKLASDTRSSQQISLNRVPKQLYKIAMEVNNATRSYAPSNFQVVVRRSRSHCTLIC